MIIVRKVFFTQFELNKPVSPWEAQQGFHFKIFSSLMEIGEMINDTTLLWRSVGKEIRYKEERRTSTWQDSNPWPSRLVGRRSDRSAKSTSTDHQVRLLLSLESYSRFFHQRAIFSPNPILRKIQLLMYITSSLLFCRQSKSVTVKNSPTLFYKLT